VFVTREWVEGLRARLPELPDAKRERYQRDYGLSAYDAGQLVASPAVSAFFERVLALHPQPKVVANWVQGELFRLLKDADVEIDETRVTPEHLAELLSLLEQGVVSGALAKQVFEEVFATGERPEAIVQAAAWPRSPTAAS